MANDDEFIYEDRYFGPNEQEFLPEVNIMERVGYEAGPHATQLELQNDPVKRFRVYTNSTAINLSSNKLLPNLTRFDVDEILRKTEVVRNPAYKNPLGFVLGYYIIKDGGGSFNSSNLKYVRDHLDTLAGDKLAKMEDVLRYGRLWLSQLI